MLQLATRRRIAISFILFTSLVVADLILWKTRPCDLFNPFDSGTLLGELLIVAGVALRTWAAGTIRKSKTLTMSGPYELVRNPLYVGSFLLMFGFAVLLRDWIAMWVFLGPILAMYLNKVRQEEIYLARNFPEVWPAYAEHTPRFVPHLRLPSLSGFTWQQWTLNHEYQVIAASLLGLLAIWGWHRAMGS